MPFQVKEIFYSLQGEGIYAGSPALFCRFCGCNLWSGREEDRTHAICTFCDTDFVNPDAGIFADEAALIHALIKKLPENFHHTHSQSGRRIIFTGGEPSLQLTQKLVDMLHNEGCTLAVESNGTHPLPQRIDWITVSPKVGTKLITTSGDELKLVYPQQGCTPENFADLSFNYFLLQPCDVNDPIINKKNIQLCLDYCLRHPQWRLGIQMHKFLGIH